MILREPEAVLVDVHPFAGVRHFTFDRDVLSVHAHGPGFAEHLAQVFLIVFRVGFGHPGLAVLFEHRADVYEITPAHGVISECEGEPKREVQEHNQDDRVEEEEGARFVACGAPPDENPSRSLIRCRRHFTLPPGPGCAAIRGRSAREGRGSVTDSKATATPRAPRPVRTPTRRPGFPASWRARGAPPRRSPAGTEPMVRGTPSGCQGAVGGGTGRCALDLVTALLDGLHEAPPGRAIRSTGT